MAFLRDVVPDAFTHGVTVADAVRGTRVMVDAQLFIVAGCRASGDATPMAAATVLKSLRDRLMEAGATEVVIVFDGPRRCEKEAHAGTRRAREAARATSLCSALARALRAVDVMEACATRFVPDVLPNGTPTLLEFMDPPSPEEWTAHREELARRFASAQRAGLRPPGRDAVMAALPDDLIAACAVHDAEQACAAATRIDADAIALTSDSDVLAFGAKRVAMFTRPSDVARDCLTLVDRDVILEALELPSDRAFAAWCSRMPNDFVATGTGDSPTRALARGLEDVTDEERSALAIFTQFIR